MVVLDHFFPKCIFYTYDGANIPPKEVSLPSPERFARNVVEPTAHPQIL